MQRATALVLSVLALIGCRTGKSGNVEPPVTAKAPDLLAIEIGRSSALARGDTSSDEISVEIRQGALPIIEKAEEALREGRRLLALQRLAFAKADLEAASYLRQQTAARPIDQVGFEAEWKRMGAVLEHELARPSSGALDGIQPAAVRALGEAALPQVRLFYDASLEYERNSTPEVGLFYLGSAQAQRDLVAFYRQLSAPSDPPPQLRAIGPELDALEAELLAAYRPPASIDRHPEFIAASSSLKEARELDAAGLRHGAMLLYLQAVLRTAPLRGGPAADRETIAAQLRPFEARLASGGVDHSLGRLFLEAAQDDLEAATADTPPVKAASVARDLLPRYFAALEPRPPAAPKPEPRVTVTLVRWPFT